MEKNMKKYCTMNRNKAFIFLQVVIISLLFISLTLFVQILLNNRFNLYKIDVKVQENFQDYDFLDEIIKQEFKNIEEKINNREIKDVTEYITLSENGEKIFLIEEYNERISFGGYRLLEDEKGKNYYNHLKAPNLANKRLYFLSSYLFLKFHISIQNHLNYILER